MYSRSRQHHGATRVGGWTAPGLLMMAACAAALHVEAAATFGTSARSLNIPSQPLDQALQEFARQSGMQIVFRSKVTDGWPSPPIEGNFIAEAALAVMLQSTPLRYRFLNANTIEITPRGPSPVEDFGSGADADPPRTRGGQHRKGVFDKASPMDEVVIRGTAQGVVATRTETPLREIPQTVSVVSLVQIREQNLNDLAEALDRTPGVTTQRDNSIEKTYLIRGYPTAAFHVDGSATLHSFSAQKAQNWYPRPDLSEFERIEVLRGADGLFSGNALPGGSINLVRKRPRADPSLRLTASAGSWNNYRGEIDATGALAFDGALRGRMVGAYVDRDFFFDTATQNRATVFAALEYDLTPNTLLTVGGSYQRDDAVPVTVGLPWNNDGTDPHLPRSTALTYDWTFYRTRTTESYFQLQQRFGDEWKLRFGAARWKGRFEYGTAKLRPFADAVTGRIDYFPPDLTFSSSPNRSDQLATEVTLTGAFEVLGTRIEMAVGGEYARFRPLLAADNYTMQGDIPSSFEDLDLSEVADPRAGLSPGLQYRYRYNYEDKGGFLALKVALFDNWSVSAGARVGQDRVSVRNLATSSAVQPRKSFEKTVTTPYAAVMYRLDDNYSLYTSYADIFQRAPDWSRRADGRINGTMHGVNIEAGVKASWRDGALNGTVAAYQLEQQRASITTKPPGSSEWLTGTSRSTGVDLELSGSPAPGWLFGGGYSFNQNRKPTAVWRGVRGPNYNLPDLSTITPKHLLKMWSSMQLPGELSRWSVGGNLHAQNSLEVEANQCITGGQPGLACRQRASRLELPGYIVLDLRAGLLVDANWRVDLSVNNVLDKRYFESVSNRSELPTRNEDFWYGAPRNYLLKVEAAF